MADWWDVVKTGADIVLSGGKAYLDYKSKKKQNEMIQKSYDDYMAQQKEAAKVAQQAVSTNLTPMTVFNKPSNKADVTDFTALAANGGLMSLATGSRPTYQEGIGPLVEQVSMQEDVSEVPGGGGMPPELAELIKSLHAEHYERLKAMGKTDEEIMKILMDMAMSMIQADDQGKTPESMGVDVQAEEMIDVKNGGIMGLRKGGRSNYRSQGIVDEDVDVEVMDPESLGDFELKTEEGVPIGPMTSDPGVDASRNEAAMMLFNKSLDQLTEIELIKLDEFLASQASGPSDKYEAQIQKLMQEMNISRELAEALILGSDPASVDFLKNLRKGGIANLRKGGRVQRYGGGVMDLEGLEKDYRTTGGFVDIGGRERADDVPARLSRNEFVMTADAVRAAGGGSINKGAQKMYNVMKHLETNGANA